MKRPVLQRMLGNVLIGLMAASCNAPAFNSERKDDARRLHYAVNLNNVRTVIRKVIDDDITEAARYLRELLVRLIME